MAAFSTLARLLTFGKAGKKAAPTPSTTIGAPGATTGGRRRPAGAPIIGQAVNREDLAATQVGATKPPDAGAAESAAVAAARLAAARTRRRAIGGNAGKVGGTRSASQANVTAGGAPKSLLGY